MLMTSANHPLDEWPRWTVQADNRRKTPTSFVRELARFVPLHAATFPCVQYAYASQDRSALFRCNSATRPTILCDISQTDRTGQRHLLVHRHVTSRKSILSRCSNEKDRSPRTRCSLATIQARLWLNCGTTTNVYRRWWTFCDLTAFCFTCRHRCRKLRWIYQ